MFFIDIAVPRDVDPKMNQVEGCFVYDIDDLQQVAAAHLADRSRESAAAEKIVSSEVEKYREHLQTREAVPAIVALQQNAEALRQAELARAAKRLAALTPEQQAAVDALTRSLTAKLLHPQIVDLRKKSDSQTLSKCHSERSEESGRASLYFSVCVRQSSDGRSISVAALFRPSHSPHHHHRINPHLRHGELLPPPPASANSSFTGSSFSGVNSVTAFTGAGGTASSPTPQTPPPASCSQN